MNREQLFTKLEQSILIIGKEMHEEHDEVANGINCSPAQKFALMNISIYGPMSVRQLADHLRVTSGAATQHIDVLEKQELVTRTINPANRREIIVQVSEKAQAAVKVFRQMQSRMFTKLFSNLDDRELGTLVALMEKVSEKYKNI
jgi:MarR family transcriptional regulator, organic hydroperoxide resistance regulator